MLTKVVSCLGVVLLSLEVSMIGKGEMTRKLSSVNVSEVLPGGQSRGRHHTIAGILNGLKHWDIMQ